MFKFLSDKLFSIDGIKIIEAKKGEEHNLTDDLAKAFIAQGIVEKVTKQAQNEDKKSNKSESEEVTNDEDFSLENVFNEKPKLLTKDQLIELGAQYGVELDKRMKEATMIKKIQQAKG